MAGGGAEPGSGAGERYGREKVLNVLRQREKQTEEGIWLSGAVKPVICLTSVSTD